MYKSELTTTEDVIRELGGVHAVAALTGRKYNAAAHWVKFKTFPSNTYLSLKTALAAKGFSAPDSLWNMSSNMEKTS